MEHPTMQRPTIASAKRRQPSRKSMTEDLLLFQQQQQQLLKEEEGNNNYDENARPLMNVVASVGQEKMIQQPTKIIKVTATTTTTTTTKPAPPPFPKPRALAAATAKPPPPPYPKPVVASAPTTTTPPPPQSATAITINSTTTGNHTTIVFSMGQQQQPRAVLEKGPVHDRAQFKRKLEEQLQNGPTPVQPAKLPAPVAAPAPATAPLVFDDNNNATINIVLGNASFSTSSSSSPALKVTAVAHPPPARPVQPAPPMLLPDTIVTAVAAVAPPRRHLSPPPPPDCPKWAGLLGLPKSRTEVSIEQRRVARLAKLRGAPPSVIRFMLGQIVTWKEINDQRAHDKHQRDLTLL